MKVVILGKGEMLSNLIEGTIDAECEIAGVFRYERVAFSRFKLFLHDFFKSSPAYTLIKQYKLHEIKCKSANSECFKKEILRLNADVILVGTWNEKLKKEIIDLPVIAAVNVHPSMLPKYRGPNPYLQTIKNMEKKSGITYHLMDKDYDSGAILTQQKIDILPSYTGKELRERTVFQARLLAAETLKKLQYGLIVPVVQNEEESSYYPNIEPSEMILDFENKTAEEIYAQIKAFHPWLPCYVKVKKEYFIPNPYRIEILDIEHNKNTGNIIAKDYKTASITVACNDNKALKFKDVKLYGAFKCFFTRFYLQYFVNIP